MQRLFGLEFHPMTDNDWYGFAGAEPDSLIHHGLGGTVLIWSPQAGVLTEIVTDEDGTHEREWQELRRVA